MVENTSAKYDTYPKEERGQSGQGCLCDTYKVHGRTTNLTNAF